MKIALSLSISVCLSLHSEYIEIKRVIWLWTKIWIQRENRNVEMVLDVRLTEMRKQCLKYMNLHLMNDIIQSLIFAYSKHTSITGQKPET